MRPISLSEKTRKLCQVDPPTISLGKEGQRPGKVGDSWNSLLLEMGLWPKKGRWWVLRPSLVPCEGQSHPENHQVTTSVTKGNRIL